MIVALVTNLSLVLGLSLLAAVLARFVKRPGVLHGIWLLVLVRLFVPPLLEVGCLPPAWSEASNQSLSSAPLEPVPIVREETPPISGQPIKEVPLWVSGWSSGWQEVLLAIWLFGSIAVLLVTLRRVYRLRRVLALAVPGNSRLQQRTTRLARQLGLVRAPAVHVISGRFSPLIWTSVGSQILVLPKQLLSQLTQAELDTLLVHELAHIRRRDHWVRVVELLAAIVFWWYPAVWWIRHRLRHYEELCCDGWVIRILPNARRAYADALVKTLELLNGRSQSLPGLACGVGHFKEIEERLRMIMKNRRFEVWTRNQKWSLILAALLILAVSPTWGETQKVAPQRNSVNQELDQLREQSKVLEQKLKELQFRRQELEWNQKQEDAQIRLIEMRNEVTRLRAAGNERDAEFVAENARILDSQIDLEAQLRELQFVRRERGRALERELRQSSQEAERLAAEGSKQEAEALYEQLRVAKVAAQQEFETLERDLKVARESQERLAREAHHNKIERLRFLGQEKEADALEKDLAARRDVQKHAEYRRMHDVEAELEQRLRGADRELQVMAREVEHLEKEGQTEQAAELRRQLGARKAALTAAVKKAKEVKKVRRAKEPPQ